MLFVKNEISSYSSPDICTPLFFPRVFYCRKQSTGKILFAKRIKILATNFPIQASCLVHYPQKSISLSYSGPDKLLNKVLFY